jgi:hypothetical protein
MTANRLRHALLALGCVLLAACDSLAVDAAPIPPHFTPEQQTRVEALISFFEHSTLDKQYAYSYALGDGRGYTLGWIGFTTSSGSAAEVVRRYAGARPLAPIPSFATRRTMWRARGTTNPPSATPPASARRRRWRWPCSTTPPSSTATATTPTV